MAPPPIPLRCTLAFPPPSHRDATPSPCWASHFMTQERTCILLHLTDTDITSFAPFETSVEPSDPEHTTYLFQRMRRRCWPPTSRRIQRLSHNEFVLCLRSFLRPSLALSPCKFTTCMQAQISFPVPAGINSNQIFSNAPCFLLFCFRLFYAYELVEDDVGQETIA